MAKLKDHVMSDLASIFELLLSTNPSSYQDNAIAKHYMVKHQNIKPKLEFHIIDRQNISVKRKISEAWCIYNQKPGINDKLELNDILKFIIK